MSTTTRSPIQVADAIDLVEHNFTSEIVPLLCDYIRIPNKSPDFDPNWKENGHMHRATKLIEDWCRSRSLGGLTVEVVELEGRTPLIYMELPGKGDDTVLLYGHLDKQPEMVGWRDGLGPWEPVIEGDRLYGRGGADDGYAAFASLTALEILQDQGLDHSRCVILIEGCEESGSYDLPFYIDHLADRIGTPSLVVCLDSGCGDYERLWSTTSLRGMVSGELQVEILNEGVHSGDASGIVPDSFRIARAVLSRLEDEHSGRLLPSDLHVDIPQQRIEQARISAEVLGGKVFDKFPFAGNSGPVEAENADLILNRTWRPTLTVTGADGLPPLQDAGNVLRPATTLKLSLRLPPTLRGKKALEIISETLEDRPPYGARISFNAQAGCDGWNAPETAPWLDSAVAEASESFYGAGPAAMGEGGTIPFMGMLGDKFPSAQFLITGVLGPESNAHGPNEFLHIPSARRLSACVASVLVRQFAAS
ncbi:MAG: peptidase M20 [Planctomycetes bacterium]|jgi:acetylornithine deacetylase/succinyl-diaminopimelate desuccinylase-like protein|nr:peptidase M20 [Planctomycetota bacterium]